MVYLCSRVMLKSLCSKVLLQTVFESDPVTLVHGGSSSLLIVCFRGTGSNSSFQVHLISLHAPALFEEKCSWSSLGWAANWGWNTWPISFVDTCERPQLETWYIREVNRWAMYSKKTKPSNEIGGVWKSREGLESTSRTFCTPKWWILGGPKAPVPPLAW